MSNKRVEIEFLMQDRMTPGMKQAYGSVVDLDKAIGHTGKTAEDAGIKIGNSFLSGVNNIKDLTEAFQAQKKVVADLERQYESAKAAFDKANVGSQDTETQKRKKEASRLFQEVRAELDAEKKSLGELEKAYDSYSKKIESKSNTYMTQLRQIKEEMISLLNADGTVSRENIGRYEELQRKLTEVGTAYRRVNQEQKSLITGGSQLSGVISGITGLSGAFSAGQGIMSLFVKDNERLASIQTKLQAAMAITIGLQQVSTTLHQTSAFRINTVAKATQLWNGAVKTLNTNLGISQTLSKGLVGIGIGAIIAGVTVAIKKYREWNREKEEAARLDKIVTDSLREAGKEGELSARKQTVSLKLLYEATQNETKAKKERLRAAKELQAQYPAYFENLSQEEILAGRGATAYHNLAQSIIAASKARAAADRITENHSKILDLEEKRTEAEAKRLAKETERKYYQSMVPTESYGEVGIQQTLGFSKLARDAKGDVEKLGKEIDNYNTEIARLNAANTKLAETINIEDLLFEPNPTKSNASGSSLDKLRKEAQAMADLERKVANEEIKRLLDGQSKQLENEQALLDIEADGWEKRYKQAELNHKKNLLAIEKRTQELIEKEQEAEKDAWKLSGEKGTFTPSVFTAEGLFNTNPEAKKEIETSRDTENKVNKAAIDALHKELLDKYKDYARRRLDVEKQYQDDVRALSLLPESDERESAILEAEKKRKEAIKAINEEEANETKKTSDLFIRLFADASQQSVAEIRKVIDEVQVLYDYLANTKDEDITDNFGFTASQLKSFKGDAEQLKAIMDGLIAKKKELAGKSEFEAFSMAIDTALKKIKKGGKENIGEGIAGIGSAITSVMPSIEKFGEDLGAIFGDEAAENISIVTDLLGATVEVGTGVGKIMSGDVVGGIQDAISGLAKVFSMASDAEKRHQQALREIAERRLAVQRQYNLLLLEQNLLLKEATTIFGEQEITKAVNAVKNYAESIRQLKEAMRGEAPDEMLATFNKKAYDKQLKDYEDGVRGLRDNARIVTGHKKTGFMGWGHGKDTYSSILDVYDDVLDAEGNLNAERIKAILENDKLKKGTREYLEELLALHDQAEAASQALSDYLNETFGALGGDLMSSITSAIRDEGLDAWTTFGEAGAKVIEKLGEQLAYELFFSARFAQLENDLKAIYNLTDDPEEIARRQMELVGKFYETIGGEMSTAQAFLEEWKRKAAEQGFDLWAGEDDGYTQSGKAGAFTTLTQDQGAKLEGLFTSVQHHVSSLDDKATDLSEAMYESLDVLNKIEENTRNTAKYLTEIRDDIRAMIRDGLNVK